MSRILHALAIHAEQRPHEVAVQGDSVRMSWQGLVEESNRLAELIGQAFCLGLVLQNSPAWVVADVTALRLGTVCVPVPGFFSLGQKRHVLEDAGVDVLVTDDACFLDILGSGWQFTELSLAGQSVVLARRQGTKVSMPSGTAKITYTSGTTGTPKGVCLGLDAMEQVALSLETLSQATVADKAMALLPLSILLENIGSVYVPLLSGASMLLFSPEQLGIQGSSQVDVQRLGEILKRHRPTAVILPPQLLKLFLGLAAAGQLPDSFRFIAVGGASLSTAQLEAAWKAGLPVYQGYGLSEAGSVVAMNSPGAIKKTSVGRPLPHCQVEIAEDGEILVRGDALYLGYLHQDERDAREYLSTGDLGYLDEEGFLHVMGRKKNLIITAYGRNLSPEWLEAELTAEPEIAQAAVFGEARPWLTAVLVPGPGASSDAVNAAVKRVNERLPDYARVLGYVMAEEVFTEVNQQATANGRPRREEIYRHYKHPLDALYPGEKIHVL